MTTTYDEVPQQLLQKIEADVGCALPNLDDKR